MESYPRIKEFTFEIQSSKTIPAWQTGRLDLLAVEIYGDSRFYKVLAAANNIRVAGGYRAGIRTNEEALASELERKGVPLEEIPGIVNEKMLTARSNNFDWLGYNNISYGYLSDAFASFELLIPTFESADKYLDRFEYIVPDTNSE